MRSLSIAGTGMLAQQTNVDVISNNIANMNTTAFKRQRAEFQDLLYQNIRRVGSQSSENGSMLPSGAQIGLGVKVAGISTNWTQGSTQNTGRSTDFMINGDGFFVTRAGNENLYTRAGSFDYDGAGNLVTFTRDIVHDLIAELVASVIVWAAEALLIITIPVVAAQIASAVVKWAGRILAYTTALVTSLTNLTRLLQG